MFAVCTSGSSSEPPLWFQQGVKTVMSVTTADVTRVWPDLCAITSLALKIVVKGKFFTLVLTKIEMWTLSFKEQLLGLFSQFYQYWVKAWLYVSQANFLISSEIVICLWIKHALCCRQAVRGHVMSAIFIPMILVDCKCCHLTWCIWPEWTKAKPMSRLIDELTNRLNLFQQTQQSQQNDTMPPRRIL